MEQNTLIKSKIESLLYISTRPLKFKKLLKILEIPEKDLRTVLDELKKDYNESGKGITVVEYENSFKFATNPENAGFLEEYVKEEISGELTRPSLEALAVIAYRSPISKYELELIRGVNCSLILRNLMIKGLIKSEFDKITGLEKYSVTMDFIRYLGLTDISNLPNYEKWSSHEIIEKLLNKQIEENQESFKEEI